jgi:hypothetical protein
MTSTGFLFLIFTLILLTCVNIQFSDKLKHVHNFFLIIGLCTSLFQFLLIISLVGFEYSEDMASYYNWFESVAHNSTLSGWGINDKGVALSYLFYVISIFSDKFYSFQIFIALYSIFFLIYFTYYSIDLVARDGLAVTLLLIFSLLLVNRIFMTNATHIIRSYLGMSMLLIATICLFQRRMSAIIFYIASFLFHKLQFILSLIPVTLTLLIPYRVILMLGVLGVFELYLGLGVKFFIDEILVVIAELDFYSSVFMVEGYRRQASQLTQLTIYLIIPLMIIALNLTNAKFSKLSFREKFWVKFLYSSAVLFCFMANATPRASRLLVFLIILVYPVFLKHSTGTQRVFYINAVILINFIAICRNLDSLII